MDDAEFATRRRGLSAQLASVLQQLFVALGSWRDADVAGFVEQAVPAVEGTQAALAQLTAVYVAERAAEVNGVDGVLPPVLDPTTYTGLRDGVSMDDVYARPFVTLRTALARGRTLEDAIRLATVRLGEIVEMDMQQTYAHAADAAMAGLPEDVRPRFWARVPQGPENCALCLVAATQRYRVGDLNKIHPGCDCAVKPLAVTDDPGQVIAPELLERAHDAVREMTGTTDRGGRAPDYRKLMVQMTGRHSEVGQMLHFPGDHFDTGPAA